MWLSAAIPITAICGKSDKSAAGTNAFPDCAGAYSGYGRCWPADS
jgi:hypothetical protein